jgi:alpha-L-arabinofuranosidase
MKIKTTARTQLLSFIAIVMLLVILIPFNCEAQVATININSVNTNVMNNTPLLFGITFDSRTSMMGNSTSGLIGYYDTSGVIIPQVDAIFNNFPISTLRYPGNGIAVGFNWKKSIGPVNSRLNQNLLGTLGSPQPVKFGFDEFMSMTAAKGVPPSEIQIMVPIYDSTATGLTLTQSKAVVPYVIDHNADWVEYCNAPNDSSNPGGGIDWASVRAANGHPTPYGIKIWNIGNEPWSGFEYGPSYDNCNSYLASVTPIINAMLAIDSTIKITMPTTGNPTYSLGWSYALLNSSLVASGKIYALSQHYFPTENNSAQSVYSVNNSLNTLITVSATKGVKVFVGDYAHYIVSPNPTIAQQDSAMQWLGANLEADFLLMLSQKSTIERANFWVYGNAIATWHPIRKNSPGNYTLMPAAEIYKLLYPAFLNNSVQVTTTSPPASDGINYSVRSNAFISNDKNYLNIVAVNRDKNNTVPLQVSGVSAYTINNTRILSATSNTSETINETSATTDISGNFIMPPMSILILEYVNPTVGINQINLKNTTIQIYPNPTDNVLKFMETLENVEVYNSYGQLVISKIKLTDSISVGHLTAGTYFIKTNKGVVKFVIID